MDIKQDRQEKISLEEFLYRNPGYPKELSDYATKITNKRGIAVADLVVSDRAINRLLAYEKRDMKMTEEGWRNYGFFCVRNAAREFGKKTDRNRALGESQGRPVPGTVPIEHAEAEINALVKTPTVPSHDDEIRELAIKRLGELVSDSPSNRETLEALLKDKDFELADLVRKRPVKAIEILMKAFDIERRAAQVRLKQLREHLESRMSGDSDC